jgi:hypothetical protein
MRRREELRRAVLLVVQAPRMPLWILTSLVLFNLNMLGAWLLRSRYKRERLAQILHATGILYVHWYRQITTITVRMTPSTIRSGSKAM